MKNNAYRFTTLLAIIFYLLVFSGLMGFVGIHGLGKDNGVHIVHHIGAITFTGFVVIGLASQLYKNAKFVAGFQQVLAAMLGMIVTGFIVGDPDNYGDNLAIFDLAMLMFIIPVIVLYFLHPNRSQIFRFQFKDIDKTQLYLGLLVLIPLSLYGVQQALLQRNSYPPLSDIHHAHWHAMADWAFATIIIVLVSSLRAKGFIIPTLMSAIGMLFIGTASIVNTQAPSSLGFWIGVLVTVVSIIQFSRLYLVYKK